jgi:hypothetical protein
VFLILLCFLLDLVEKLENFEEENYLQILEKQITNLEGQIMVKNSCLLLVIHIILIR